MPATIRLRGRFELTAWALALIVLTPFAFASAVVTVVFGPLSVIVLLIPMFLVSAWALRRMAGVHRRWLGRVTGSPVVSPYRSVADTHAIARWRTRGTDPATWRDILWGFVDISVALALRCIVVELFFGGIWAVVLPCIWPALPGGSQLDLTGIPVHSQTAAIAIGVPYALISWLLWWVGTPYLMRADIHLARALLAPRENELLARRVQQLAASRADTVDTQAAELRRIERDLHDGAQARLVALGMSLGLADKMVDDDPAQARALLAEARTTSSQALQELRDIVRGIHPPVLADRGLDGAVRALGLANPLPTDVEITLPGRLPAPVESAAYFAVAETLTNIIKHTDATKCWVRIEYAADRLSLLVGDDGSGGADPAKGTGLRGIDRRLAAFDGTLVLSSPIGGPTVIVMYLPCQPVASPGQATARQ